LSDCCLTPGEQFFSYIIERTSYISMRWWWWWWWWWCLLYTWPIRL